MKFTLTTINTKIAFKVKVVNNRLIWSATVYYQIYVQKCLINRFF